MREEEFKEVGITVMGYVKEALGLTRDIVHSPEKCVFYTIPKYVATVIAERYDKIISYIELLHPSREDQNRVYMRIKEYMPSGMGLKTDFDAKTSGKEVTRLIYNYDKFSVLEAKRVQLALTVLTILALGIEDV